MAVQEKMMAVQEKMSKKKWNDGCPRKKWNEDLIES